jgi:hypothetical protein
VTKLYATLKTLISCASFMKPEVKVKILGYFTRLTTVFIRVAEENPNA